MALPSNENLIKQWTKRRRESEGSLGLQHDNASEDHAFHAGDEMYYAANIQDKGQKRTVVFNKVKPYIDAAVGFMIQLRRKPEYQARITGNDQQREYSDYLSSLSDYARENANMDSIESRQDREMLVTGYGAIDTNVIYEKNPDGEVAAEVIPYHDIYWDPAATEPNILDATYIFRRKAFHLKEALKRFKGTVEGDFETYYTDDETNFEYNRAGGEYDKISYGGGQRPDLVAVYYYQWWSLERYYRADNPLLDIEDPAQANLIAQMMISMRDNRAEVSNEDVQEDLFEFDPLAEHLVMTGTIKRDLSELFGRFGIEMDVVDYQKRVYYTALMTGKKVLAKFKSPDQQGFTIKVKTGTYHPDEKIFYGMVAGLKEPARYANKALTEILYVIASNSKGGVMYEEGAVSDSARFEQQWASTKAAIMVEDGALSGGKIAPKTQAALPNGYEGVYQISDEALAQVSGLNREFLGISQNKAVSAILETQRINQAVTTLATYFDAIALYQVEHARLMLTFLRQLAENSQGRLIRIIGVDGASRYDELSLDMFADEYDVRIGEAPTSAIQKEETGQFMIRMAEKAQEFGTNIWGTAIKYVPNIKESDRQDLAKAFAEAEQAKQQSQEQAIASQQEQQSFDRDLQASIAEQQRADASQKLTQSQVSVVKLQADTDKTHADTAKTLTETQRIVEENEILQSGTYDSATVSI